MAPAGVYVSVTGLRLKSGWQAPRFWWHAVRSMAQARRAAGNLLAETRTVDGVHHTLSAWKSDADMRAYLVTGPHREAMAVFPRIAAGRVHGFWSAEVPGWEEALRLWQAQGREV